jgi:hypothetical protein
MNEPMNYLVAKIYLLKLWALNEEEIESHYMIEMKTYLKYMLNETDFTNEKYFMHTIIESKLRQKYIQ